MYVCIYKLVTSVYVCQFLFVYNVFLPEEESSCFQNVCVCVCEIIRQCKKPNCVLVMCELLHRQEILCYN